MKISKIQLLNSGTKGLCVTFLEEQVKDGYTFFVENTKKPKYPIHIGLEKGILELRKFALEYSGFFKIATNDVEKKFIAENANITNIIFIEDGFKFKFNFDFNGKQTKIETDEITSADGYSSFDTVKDLLESIKEETESYLKGNKKVSDREMAEMFARQNKQITMEFLDGLEGEELKEFCTKTLTKMGSVVAHIEIEEEAEELKESVG